MEGPAHVVVAHNYSLQAIAIACARDERPRHHLFGMDRLSDAGFEVSTPSTVHRRTLEKISRALRMRLGDLSRQLGILRHARAEEADVIVCIEMSSARALGLLRRLGLLRIPLVGLLHPYEPRTPFTRFTAGGFDRVLCLSPIMAKGLSRPEQNPHTVTTWGPDLDFRDYEPCDGEAIVAIGKTNRDLPLLARAAAAGQHRLIVHDRLAVPPHERRTERRTAGFATALDDLRAASVVAIPLRRTDGCFGITELNDALALGKPIVMTRCPYIDVDLEAVGCGIWVDEGDEAGWRQALDYLSHHPEVREEMGAKGRAFAEERWNYDLFSKDLIRAVADMTNSPTAPA